MGDYKTIKSVSSAYYKDKGSKFWAYAIPVSSITKVEKALNEVKLKHPTCGHYCYAYKIGLGINETIRANDDGEPNGSAGLPILNQIKSKSITDTLVIVAREFGGTKLGISGLISAYKFAALEALNNNTLIKKVHLVQIVLEFKYDILGEIRSILDRKNIKVDHATYNDLVCFTLNIKKSKLNEMKNLLNHLELKLVAKEV